MPTVVKIPPLATFAVGSLPHTQLELGLQSGLAFDIPTLPQLPRIDPAEFMLAQALEGMPGLRIGADGLPRIDAEEWSAAASTFIPQLDEALSGQRLDRFEPSATAARAWRPFLWEIEQRKPAFAKAQLAGPVTTLWATTLIDGAPLSTRPDIAASVVRLVIARSIAMTRALAATGARPLFCFDEPGLYAFDKRRPAHLVELGELRVALASVQRAGAVTMVHCCGNTDWATVFALPVDFVAADVRLSLAAQLASGEALDRFLERGGRLALGIIPTNAAEHAPATDLVDDALATLDTRRERVLAGAILGPACGLAMRSVTESDLVSRDLREARRLLFEG